MFTWPELVALYRIHETPRVNLQPQYNIAPTREIWTLIPDGDRLRLTPARWGLVPGWWSRSLGDVPATFNARAETVAEKPMYRAAFRSRRCIVPVSGFYEWTGPKSERKPFYITRRDAQPLCLAGLWERWTNRETGEEVVSATVIVTEANAFMAELHHRMPVILEPDEIGGWIENGDPDLLRPAPTDILQAWPVTTRMNSGLYQAPDAVEPWR